MRSHQNGKISIYLAIGTLIILGISTLVSSAYLNNKNNTQTTSTKAQEAEKMFGFFGSLIGIFSVPSSSAPAVIISTPTPSLIPVTPPSSQPCREMTCADFCIGGYISKNPNFKFVRDENGSNRMGTCANLGAPLPIDEKCQCVIESPTLTPTNYFKQVRGVGDHCNYNYPCNAKNVRPLECNNGKCREKPIHNPSVFGININPVSCDINNNKKVCYPAPLCVDCPIGYSCKNADCVIDLTQTVE